MRRTPIIVQPKRPKEQLLVLVLVLVVGVREIMGGLDFFNKFNEDGFGFGEGSNDAAHV